MFKDKMVTPATPERVYTLCKIVEKKARTVSDARQRMEPALLSKDSQVYFPDYQKVEQMVTENGINLFYESVEKRHLCCQIRKIEPLKRALKGLKVWITGLRRSQSVTRKNMQLVEYDKDDNIIKLNPLIDWSEEDVKNFVKENHVPYNKLHDKGFPSIGCQPCTRAVAEGEDIRSGRWWWENPEHRECGLHVRS